MSHDNKKKLLKIIESFYDQKNDTYGFQGEFDSNQTKFESESNKMKIGVHAPLKYIYICFRILRYIIDDNWELLDEDSLIAHEDNETLESYIMSAEDNGYDTLSNKLEDASCTLSNGAGFKPTVLTEIYDPKRLYDLVQKKILNF